MKMENRGQWKKVRSREQEWNEWKGVKKVQPKDREKERAVSGRSSLFFLSQQYLNILLAFRFASEGRRQRERQPIVLGDSISSLFSLPDTSVTVTRPYKPTAQRERDSK